MLKKVPGPASVGGTESSCWNQVSSQQTHVADRGRRYTRVFTDQKHGRYQHQTQRDESRAQVRLGTPSFTLKPPEHEELPVCDVTIDVTAS